MLADVRIGGLFRSSARELVGLVLGSVFGLLTYEACHVCLLRARRRLFALAVCVSFLRCFQTSDAAMGTMLALWCLICAYARTNLAYIQIGTSASLAGAILMLGSTCVLGGPSTMSHHVVCQPFACATVGLVPRLACFGSSKSASACSSSFSLTSSCGRLKQLRRSVRFPLESRMRCS